jgi:RNA polymerase sigma-32 factor
MSNMSPQQSSLSRYISEIIKFPILGNDEENRLAKRWREHGDRGAAEILVTSHLRLVVRIAKGFRGYGLPLADLVSHGNLGLTQSLRRFDPDRGVRFSTYAMWWIRSSIIEYVLSSWSIVKLGTTAAQKKMFFKLRRAKIDLQVLHEGDMPVDQVRVIARRLGVKSEDVVLMNRRLRADKSLNTHIGRDGRSVEWQEALASDQPTPEDELGEAQESAVRKRRLSAAMVLLNERERHVMVARHLSDHPLKLQQLSMEFGVSVERIRQIERRALQKIRQAIASVELVL